MADYFAAMERLSWIAGGDIRRVVGAGELEKVNKPQALFKPAQRDAVSGRIACQRAF
jgi:hypothetical protein